jgi:hypothetical protein
MSLGTYSSIAAFLAHYDVLRAEPAEGAQPAGAPNPDDAARLAEMEGIIAELTTADRDALIRAAPASSGDSARHRARAELHLRRLLVARGILAG